MKKVLLISLILVLGLVGNVWADYILVGSGDWTGSRTTPSELGIVASDGWTQANGGFKISWAISYDPATMFYSYSYTPTHNDGSVLDPETSHWILEVSESVKSLTGFFEFPVGYDIEGPQWWYAHPAENPYMPATGIYGIKFDFGTDVTETFTFLSTQAPVWGDFYVKDGIPGGPTGDGEWATAWNTGFGTDPTGSPFTNWIPVPDTTNGNGDEQDVPEPSTLLLIGTGLLGLGLYRRGKFRK